MRWNGQCFGSGSVWIRILPPPRPGSGSSNTQHGKIRHFLIKKNVLAVKIRVQYLCSWKVKYKYQFTTKDKGYSIKFLPIIYIAFNLNIFEHLNMFLVTSKQMQLFDQGLDPDPHSKNSTASGSGQNGRRFETLDGTYYLLIGFSKRPKFTSIHSILYRFLNKRFQKIPKFLFPEFSQHLTFRKDRAAKRVYFWYLYGT